MRTNEVVRELRAIACGLALIVGLGGCAMLDALRLERPTANVAGVALKSIDLQAATLQFDIDVTNPYPVALPLLNLDYALASRGSSFLSGKAEALGSVSAGSTRRIPLLAKVTYLDLLKVLQDVRPGAVVPYVAELGLSVSAPEVGELRLPLKTEGKLPVPAVPDVDITEIKWQKVDLREVTGLVMLNVVNRNQFPVDLSKITYALSLGDTQVADTSLAKRVSFGSDGGAGVVEIPLTFSPERAGLGLLGLLAGQGSGYKLRGSLDLDTPFGPMSLPVDKVSKTVFRR